MKKDIPKNTPYCYTPLGWKDGKYKIKLCPYWTIKTSKRYSSGMEYCKYLRRFLDIQDQCKDCEIE